MPVISKLPTGYLPFVIKLRAVRRKVSGLAVGRRPLAVRSQAVRRGRQPGK